VSYDNGASLPTTSIIDYSLLFLKQPGTGQFPFALNLVYGSSFTPNKIEDAQLENGVAVINKNINTDTELNAQFLRR
jgi:hypothetical protein